MFRTNLNDIGKRPETHQASTGRSGSRFSAVSTRWKRCAHPTTSPSEQVQPARLPFQPDWITSHPSQLQLLTHCIRSRHVAYVRIRADDAGAAILPSGMSTSAMCEDLRLDAGR